MTILPVHLNKVYTAPVYRAGLFKRQAQHILVTASMKFFCTYPKGIARDKNNTVTNGQSLIR